MVGVFCTIPSSLSTSSRFVPSPFLFVYIRTSAFVLFPNVSSLAPLFFSCGGSPWKKPSQCSLWIPSSRRRCCVGRLSMVSLDHPDLWEMPRDRLSHFSLAFFSCCSALCMIDARFSHSCCFSYFPTYIFTHNN